jgi:GTP pyrophosphokinase
VIDEYKRLRELILQHDPNADLDVIDKAYQLSKAAHEGQIRVSGDPYIIHPVAVACILAEMEMDATTVAAGLLHDTIEDTHCSYDQLKADFGEEIAELVDGVPPS